MVDTYYNPGGQNSYYDPNNYAETEKSNAVTSAIGGFVKGAIAFSAARFVVGGVGKLAGGAVAGGLKTAFKNSTPGTFGHSIQNTKGLGGVLKSFKPVDKFMKTHEHSWASYRKVLSDRQQVIKSLPKVDRSLGRISTALTDKKTFAAVATNVFLRDTIGGSFTSYTMDHFNKNLESQGAKDNIALWNVPGHALNYGKYLAKNAVSFTAMSQLKGAADLTAGFLGKSIQNNLSSKNGKDFVNTLMQKATSFATTRLKENNGKYTATFNNQLSKFKQGSSLTKGFRKVSTFNKTLNESAIELRTRLYNTANGYSGDNSFTESFLKTAVDFKAKYNQNKANPSFSRSRNTEGDDLYRQFKRLSNTTEELQSNNTSGSSSFENLLKMVQDTNKTSISKKSVTAEIIGAKHAKIQDLYDYDDISSTVEGLAKRYKLGDNQRSQLLSNISNMAVGGDHFKFGDSSLDLGRLSPSGLAIRALDVVGSFKLNTLVPMPLMSKSITIGSVTGISNFTRGEVGAHEFKKDVDFGVTFKHALFGDRQVGELVSIHNKSNIKSMEAFNDRVFSAGRRLYTEKSGILEQIENVHGAVYVGNTSVTGRSELQNAQVGKMLYNGVRNLTGEQEIDSAYSDFRTAREYTKEIKRSSGGIFNKLSAKFDWSPGFMTKKISDFKSFMSHSYNDDLGRNQTATQKMYYNLMETISGKNVAPTQLSSYVPYLNSMLHGAEQDVASALPMIARNSQSFFKGKLNLKYLTDDEELLTKISSMRYSTDDNIKSFLSDSETSSIFENLMNSDSSKTHFKNERHGRHKDLTILEAARLRILEFESNSDIHQNIDGSFIGLSKKLYDTGAINHSQKAAMDVMTIINTSFRKNQHDHTQILDPGKALFKLAKDKQLINNNDLIDYVANTDFKNPSFEDPLKSFSRLYDSNKTSTSFKNSKAFNNLFYANNSPLFTLTANDNDSITSSAFGLLADTAGQRVGNLMENILGFHKDAFSYGDGIKGASRFLLKTATTVGVAAKVYDIADGLVASNPFFDRTPFDSGITGAAADVIANSHIALSTALNLSGVAGVGRYLNGLMPGFTSSALGAMSGYAFSIGQTPTGRIGKMAAGAIEGRMISEYLPDFTKRTEELKEEYAGEKQVAMVANKGWLLGSTPWQGNKVVGYKPNWYVEAKSRWKASDSLYGSELHKILHEPMPLIGISVGDIVDPYYIEKKHYFSRPYHQTGGWQENLPLGLGEAVSGTIGGLIKPKKLMHSGFLKTVSPSEVSQVTAMPVPSMVEQRASQMQTNSNNPNALHNKGLFHGEHVHGLRDTSFKNNLTDSTFTQLENAMGLFGYLHKSGRGFYRSELETSPTLESAGKMASTTRDFWDKNTGGLGVYSEPIRRFMKKDNYKNYEINDIPNLLPNWLPDSMLRGDPFSRIVKGEIRLPGEAYERTHDVNYSMSARASMFGADTKSIVQYFTGNIDPFNSEMMDILDTGTHYHEAVQNWLKAENILISAEDLFYDAKNDISGHIDGIIRDGSGGGGKKALEIKSIGEKGFQKLSGPKNQHISQLNYYLHESGIKEGTILYINSSNPAEFKLYEIEYSKSKYEKDLEKIQKARAIASEMIADGKQGASRGYSYSWVDRLNILADVAPASKQFKTAKKIVEEQIRSGMLSEREIKKYKGALEIREATLRDYELYPTRFKGQIMTPDEEYNRQNINNNIKASAEYSLAERSIGAAWETFTNTNTFLTNKFFAYKDPLEHYKQNKLYGKEFTPWNTPYSSFIDPMIQRTIASENAFQGAVRGVTGLGYTFGGFGGAVAGATVGGSIGLGNQLFRSTDYLPGHVEKEREINDYFDTLKYYKNMRMSSITEGIESDQYRKLAMETQHGMLHVDGLNFTSMHRSAYSDESPYMGSFMNERNPERQAEILKILPNRTAKILEKFYKNEGSKLESNIELDSTINTMINGRTSQQYDMRALDPSMIDDDLKLKVIKNEGLNQHDFGLGWAKQLSRIKNLGGLEAIPSLTTDTNTKYEPLIDQGTVRSVILNILNNNGIRGRARIFVNNHADSNTNNITLTIQHNRIQDMREAVSNRQRYMNG